MSDHTTIKPALSAEEWADVQSYQTGCTVFRGGVSASPLDMGKRVRLGGGDDDGCIEIGKVEAPFVIALANAALPDDDPRKITPALVEYLRTAAHDAEARHDESGEMSDYEEQQQLLAWAEAISSYLPPES